MRPRRIEGASLAEVDAWLETYRSVLEQSFQRLDSLLAELQAAPARRGRKAPRPTR